MAILIKKNEVLNECIHIKKLSSGTKCYIIPKCGYGEKLAMIAVNYGSNDIQFKNEKNGDEILSPEGVAHFLEHKLFEEEWGDVFQEFAKNGADANAFTDSNKTAYYFSCKNNFNANFKLLLEFVQSPYFTDESAEREKGIISQEITMYDDDPYWKVYFNMLKGMYKNHTVKNNIAGSVNSIKEIDGTVLNNCYKSFYCPENMTIVCSGDFDVDEILGEAEKYMRKADCKRAKTIYENEPDKIVKPYIEENMEISKPIFNIGYKETANKPDAKKIYGMKILMDLLAGESSALYNRMYEQGLIDEELGLQYMCGEGFAFSIFSGSADEPKKVGKQIQSEIEKLIKSGIDIESFERLKKKHTGRFIRGFNSINAISMSQIDMGLKGLDLLDGFEALNKMKKEYLEEMLKSDFIEDKQVISVIKK